MLKFFYDSKKSKKGFTLIELVVVIAILGILALIAIPRLQNATINANKRAVETNLRTIDSAVMMSIAAGDTIGTITAADLVTDGYLASWPATPTGTTYTYDSGTGRAEVAIDSNLASFGLTAAIAASNLDELTALAAWD